MSNTKNILLIGGAGYLGTHLRNELSSYNIFYTSTSAKPNAIVLDLLKKESYNGILGRSYDIIFLLASSLKGLGTTELKNEYLDTDSKGLSTFLQFIHENKLTKKLVYVSSMTVYTAENASPVQEDSLLSPLSTYGLSKVLGENIFSFYCNAHAASGVIFRVPGIYGGERKSGFIYNTAHKCIHGQQIELRTDNLGYWETIHVEDLCCWIKEFIQNYNWPEKSDVFNIGYGVKTDFIECAYLIKELTGSASEVILQGEKGYTDLYLDNSKVKKFSSARNKYKESLTAYLNTFSK